MRRYSELLEAVERDLVLRDLQPTTADHYRRVVQQFLHFVDGDVAGATSDHARDFLLRLREWGRSSSLINAYHAALTFWFSTTLARPDVMATVPRCKNRRHTALPTVPTVEEVGRIFAATADPFFRTLFQTIYETGLRSTEVRNLLADNVWTRSTEVPSVVPLM